MSGGGREEEAGRTILLAKQKGPLTSSLEQFVKSPPQLQPFDWAGVEKERKTEGGGAVPH